MTKWLHPEAPFFHYPKRRPSGTPGTGPVDTLDPLPISTGYTGQPNGLPPAWTRSSIVNRAYPAITAPYPFGYGQVQGMGAQIWYDSGPDPFSGTRTVMGVVCCGPVHSLGAYQVDGTVPGNHVGLILNYYLGTASQVVDPNLFTAYGETSGFPGLAYWVMKTPNTPAGAAINVQNVISDGELLLVRDPRTDPTLVNRYYRRNPALAIADILTSRRYGARAPDSAINWTSVSTAADDCDALLADGITPRFTLDILINNPQTPDNHVQNLRTHAQLNVTYNNGQYQIWMDKSQMWSGVSFFDNAPGGQLISAAPYKIAPATQVFTRARGDFWNLGARKADFAIDEDPDITTGLVEMIPQTYSLLGCSTYDQDFRISRYLRKLSAFDKSYPIRVGPSGARVLPGLRIHLTSLDYNMADQDMFVIDCQPAPDPDGFGLSGLAWDLVLRKYDDSLYDDTQVTTTSNTAPAVPSPYDGTPEVTLPEFSIASEYWNAPQLRDSILYGSTFWSSIGMASFTASKVNDGIVNVTAFQFNTGGHVKFDAGSGITKRFRECKVSATTNILHIPFLSIEYSDDGATYSSVTGLIPCFTIAAGLGSQIPDGDSPDSFPAFVLQWDDMGVHRYWRVTSSGDIGACSELQFYQWLGAAPFIKGYNFYDGRILNNPKFLSFVDISGTPTPTVPIPGNFLLTTNTTVEHTVSYFVTAVNSLTGKESGGLGYYATVAFAFAGLDGVVDHANTWSAPQTFNAGIIVTDDVQTDAIGINCDPTVPLEAHGAVTDDVVGSFGNDAAAGPAFNFGYAGASFGRGAAFFNVRPDAGATAPNPSLRFAIANVVKMILTNLGRLGIGTGAPGYLLDVAGDVGVQRLITGTATPTISVNSGLGGSPGATLSTGASDLAGVITLTPSSGALAIISITVTFSGAYGANASPPVLTLLDGTGSWNNAATCKLTASSTTAFTVQISNSAVALTPVSTYKLCYHSIGM